jgi:alkylation response protein AidB-like acyl-CoA dehydrogenase
LQRTKALQVNTPLIPRQELDFLLFDWLHTQTRIDRGTVDAILDLTEQVATDLFLPHYRQADASEPTLDRDGGVHILPAIREALHEYASLGLFGLSFPETLGGMGLPQTVAAACYSLFASANIATAAYPMLTTSNARLIAKFGSPAQVDHFARPQIEGRWFGTMCLSEPQAGSSLGDVRTRAIRDGEDALGARHRLIGNKMWISGGDQDASENIVHLVLAKVQQADGSLPEGTRGISLFIVPKRLPDGPNDIIVAGLNHKMGYRGTANCLLSFGDRGGALGWRVGMEGQGLQQMFMMMNEARIYVGLGAAALGFRGYRHAAGYAAERVQGRPPGQRGGAPVPIISHVDVRRMLLQQKAYVEGALALCLYCARLSDDDDDESHALLGLLTPVAKTWPSEFGLAANDIAIQIHGAYGYTRDFDVEQLYRDNRLNPIHEGTTGIQAIDLVGRKILRADPLALSILQQRIDATCHIAGSARPAEVAALKDAWQRVLAVIERLRAAEPARAFDDATLFLRAFGHTVLAWLWLDQIVAAASRDDLVAQGKRAACRFFFETELPQALAWLQIAGTGTNAAASADARIFQ